MSIPCQQTESYFFFLEISFAICVRDGITAIRLNFLLDEPKVS